MQRYEIRFALLSYNYGIVLAAGGILSCFGRPGYQRISGWYFSHIWTLVMGIISFQHRRFEYYFAINFVLFIRYRRFLGLFTYGKGLSHSSQKLEAIGFYYVTIVAMIVRRVSGPRRKLNKEAGFKKKNLHQKQIRRLYYHCYSISLCASLPLS
jgi:hypothetical protein